MEGSKERSKENLINTMYDFVERTLQNEEANPQALAIVPSVLEVLDKNFIQREDETKKP